MSKPIQTPSALGVSPKLDAQKHQFLTDVATLYYRHNLTQSEIAQRIGVSRASVSRLLSEAHDYGVVEITIHAPIGREETLSYELKRLFKLQDAYVITAGTWAHEQIIEALGVVAARVLYEHLLPEMTLGISWNTSVYQVARALQDAHQINANVIQLTGIANRVNPILDGPDLVRCLAHKLGGQYHDIAAPLMVSNLTVRDALLADDAIRARLDMARVADVALIGIGAVEPELCTLLQIGYINKQTLNSIIESGAVGEVLSNFYDIDGNILNLELHDRVIGLSAADLRQIDYVIGVAGGDEKADAIIGALHGGYIDCLVTDDRAAQAIIDKELAK